VARNTPHGMEPSDTLPAGLARRFDAHAQFLPTRHAPVVVCPIPDRAKKNHPACPVGNCGPGRRSVPRPTPPAPAQPAPDRAARPGQPPARRPPASFVLAVIGAHIVRPFLVVVVGKTPDKTPWVKFLTWLSAQHVRSDMRSLHCLSVPLSVGSRGPCRRGARERRGCVLSKSAGAGDH
jgi:hypothetical protein